MSINPGEIANQFEGPLRSAELQAKTASLQQDATKTTYEIAAEAHREAIDHAKNTEERVAELREIAEIAIDACSQQDLDAWVARMQVQGRDQQEIDEQISHLENFELQEDESLPVAAVVGSRRGDDSCSTTISYGKLGGFPLVEKDGDKRSVFLSMQDAYHFGTRWKDDKRAMPIMFALPGQDRIDGDQRQAYLNSFEDVRFAGSSKEVDAVVDRYMSGQLEATPIDYLLLNDFGLPAIVVYGEDAIRRVSKIAAERNQGHNALFVQSALSGLGIETGAADIVLNEDRKAELYYLATKRLEDVARFITRRGLPASVETINDINRTQTELEFLAPILETIDVSGKDILGIITRGLEEEIHPLDQFGPTASRIYSRVEFLKNFFGIKTEVSQRAVVDTAVELKRAVVNEAMANRLKFTKRSGLKKSLREFKVDSLR